MSYISYKIEGYELTYSNLPHGPRIRLACEKNYHQTINFKPNGSMLPFSIQDLNYHLDDFQNIHNLLIHYIDDLYLYIGNEGTGYDCGISIGRVHGY